MEIRIDRSALLRALYLAQSVADRKSTTPVVANVVLRTEDTNSIICAATDLRISVVTDLNAEVMAEGGLCVSAKHFYDIVKSLANDEVHVRRADSAWAEIRAGKAHYRLVGLSDRDFPKLPDHREVRFTEVDAKSLVSMIAKTAFSVSTEENRPHLAGIYFESDGQKATMVSTDGHRLSRVDRQLGSGPVLERGVMLPRKGVMEIRRLLEGVDGACDIGFSSSYVFVKAADVVLSVVLVDAQFPPYRQVIPAENDKSIVLNRVALLEALRRVAIMSSERSWGIRIELAPGKLRITSDNPDLGEADEEIDVEYQGQALTVGFNARYFIDVISEIDEPQVCLEFNGELDPGLIRPYDSHDYVGVIMPMRI